MWCEMKQICFANFMIILLIAVVYAAADERHGISQLGDFCGGMFAIPCNKSLSCKLDGDYPDACGVCVASCPNRDEIQYECKPFCTNTCMNYGKPDVICTTVCESGCFCRPDLVKRETDGKCVRPEMCPKQSESIRKAGEGDFCGGIAAFQCDKGLCCKLDGTFPDAGGKCVYPDDRGICP